MSATTVPPVPAPSRSVVVAVVAVTGALVLVGGVALVVPRLSSAFTSTSTGTEFEQPSPQKAAELQNQRAQDQALDQAAKLGGRAATLPKSLARKSASKAAYEMHFGAVAAPAAVPAFVRVEQVGGQHLTYPFTGLTGAVRADEHGEGMGAADSFVASPAPTTDTNHQWNEQVGGRHGTYPWSP